MEETIASFTPDQLQFIGMIAVGFGGSFVVFVWRASAWKAKVDYDMDNFGYLLGTEKGLDRAKKRAEKLRGKNGTSKESSNCDDR